MDKALAIYGYILKEYLSECFANQQNIDPIALNKERYRAKALFIAICFFKKYNPQHNEIDTSATANAWLKEFFAEGNFFSSLIDSTNQNLKELINESFENFIEGPLLDIATLYESLLSVETGNENAGTEITNGKNYKNKLGSYYTPSLFARSVTEKTIDSFFQLNFDVSFKENPKNISLNKAIVKEISKVTFVDFSCGGGNFITEIIYYFENLFNGIDISPLERRSLLRAVALNISAYDVDVIALEVAKLNLLLQINEPKLYEVLQANFTHANFLLHTDTAISAITKTDVFSSGYIYHENLSLNTDNLKRYDIIVGNPPWEKIRFEEKKFYALYTTAIANNHFKSTRASEIKATEKVHLNLAEFSRRFKSEIEKSKLALKKSGFFSLSNKGELNTYALFTEAAVKLRTERGVVGLVLKSGLVTSQVNQKLFQFLTGEHLVLAIYDFINRKKIFAIDSRERFCFLLLGDAKSNKFKVSMNLTAIDQLDEKENEIELSYDSLRLLNPQTAMLPNFSTKEEVEFLLRISNDFPFDKYS